MFPSGRNAVGSSQNRDGHDSAESGGIGGNVGAESIAQLTTNNAVSPSEVNHGDVCTLPLERCMRITPHDQNTGAFFVAVFHKRSPFPGSINHQALCSWHFEYSELFSLAASGNKIGLCLVEPADMLLFRPDSWLKLDRFVYDH